MNPVFLPLLFGATAILTWIFVGVLIRLAPRIGLLDRPNERSSHSRVTPRGGGIGFVVASLLLAPVAVGMVRMSGVSDGFAGEWPLLGGALGAALLVALISLRDDFHSLPAGLRLACHLTAAAVAVYVLAPLAIWALPGGTVHFGPVLAVGLTLVWIAGLTNVYNFMDGIDGIAGLQGLVAGAAWTIAGGVLHLPLVAGLGALLAGGCAGFLAHNWSPAKIFMGDVGSAFLGFLFAVAPLLALAEAARRGGTEEAARLPLFAVLVVWPFVGDGLLTFLRRAARREPVWQAHRSHLYQRLIRSGWAHAGVSLLYGGWAALCAAVGVWWLRGGPGAAVLALTVPLATLAGMFIFVSRQERQAQSDPGGRR